MKGPVTPGWNRPEHWLNSLERIEAHWKKNPLDGVGILLGASNLCSLDIDDYECAKLALAIIQIDLDRMLACGYYPISQGQDNRYKILFAAPEDMPRDRFVITWPDRETGKPRTILELRGGDHQDAIPPSWHPTANRPYRWIFPLPNGPLPEPPPGIILLWHRPEERAKLAAACPWKPPDPPKPGKQDRTEPWGDESIIVKINAQYDIADLLTEFGYTKEGNRFKRPGSKSTPGVVFLEDGKIYSHHAGDELNADHDRILAHDAFDLLTKFRYDGDVKRAIRNETQLLGLNNEEIFTFRRSGTSRVWGSASEEPSEGEKSAPPQDEAGTGEKRWPPPGYVLPGGLSTVTREWIVEDTFEKGRMYLIFAPPKAGKSVSIEDMLLHMTYEMPWAGRRTVKAVVVWVAGEAAEETIARAVGWRLHHGKPLEDDPHFVVRTAATKLAQRDKVQALQNDLKIVKELFPDHVLVIVFDSLSRNLGADENSTSDMAAAMGNVSELLMKALAATIFFIHHSGRGDTDRSRGSSVMDAEVDGIVQLSVKVAGDTPVICFTTKGMRATVSGGSRLEFILESAVLADRVDNFDKPITVPLLRYSGDHEPAQDSEAVIREALALAILQEQPEGKMPVKEWRAAFKRRLAESGTILSDRQGADDEDDGKVGSAFRIAWKRAKDTLKKKQKIELFKLGKVEMAALVNPPDDPGYRRDDGPTPSNGGGNAGSQASGDAPQEAETPPPQGTCGDPVAEPENDLRYNGSVTGNAGSNTAGGDGQGIPCTEAAPQSQAAFAEGIENVTALQEENYGNVTPVTESAPDVALPRYRVTHPYRGVTQLRGNVTGFDSELVTNENEKQSMEDSLAVSCAACIEAVEYLGAPDHCGKHGHKLGPDARPCADYAQRPAKKAIKTCGDCKHYGPLPIGAGIEGCWLKQQHVYWTDPVCSDFEGSQPC